ncbi:MAG TPA: hypothetical protein VGG75_37425 [Trebonia sp.]|jgi:hypothetical protein
MTIRRAFSLGLGTLFRSSAGANIAAITVLFISLILGALLPDDLEAALGTWISLTTVIPVTRPPAPGPP